MDNNTEMTTSKKYEIMRGEILDYIKKIGFTPINIQCGNGYFIFDMGENSVVNFWIKELKGWKFGIWFYSPKPDEDGKKRPDYCQFFAQRELFIDKFKPAASNYCEEIKVYEENNKFFDKFSTLYVIKNMLYEMKYHPFISFYKGVAYNDYIDRKSLIWFYIKENWNVRFYDCKEKFNRWKDCTITRIYLNHVKKVLEKKPNVGTVKVIDGEDEDWSSYPRYHIDVYFNKDSTELEEAEIQEKYFNNSFYTKVVSKECYFYFFNPNNMNEDGRMYRYTYSKKEIEEIKKGI